MKGNIAMRHPALAALLLLTSATAWAVDGVIEINHAKALAGGVTPGDTPGYPISITEPGSYRLTSNLLQPNANTDVISLGVLVNDVSIDLNGFVIQGANVCTYTAGPPSSITCTGTGAGSGVRGGGARSGVRNGKITGMGGWGVLLDGGEVDHVQVSHCGGIGIRTGRVTQSSSKNNLLEGITLYSASATAVIMNSEAESNGGSAGIRCYEPACSVINNVSARNIGAGILAQEAVVTGNTANQNGSYGIDAHTSLVSGNTATRNVAEGLRVVSSGYGNNVLADNKGTTVPADQITASSSHNFGGNVCATSLCP